MNKPHHMIVCIFAVLIVSCGANRKNQERISNLILTREIRNIKYSDIMPTRPVIRLREYDDEGRSVNDVWELELFNDSIRMVYKQYEMKQPKLIEERESKSVNVIDFNAIYKRLIKYKGDSTCKSLSHSAYYMEWGESGQKYWMNISRHCSDRLFLELFEKYWTENKRKE